MVRRFGLARELRIRRRNEFVALQRAGGGRHTEHFVVLVTARGDRGPSRIGVTVTKRIGNAVERNRVKRRVREFFRQNRERLPGERDFVFIAKSGAERLSYADVARELSRGTGLSSREANS